MSQTEILILIGNQDRDFSFIPRVKLVHAPDRHDGALSCVGIGALGDQRHFAVVVAETDAEQALMGHAPAQAERVEIAQINAAIGERLMKS